MAAGSRALTDGKKRGGKRTRRWRSRLFVMMPTCEMKMGAVEKISRAFACRSGLENDEEGWMDEMEEAV